MCSLEMGPQHTGTFPATGKDGLSSGDKRARANQGGHHSQVTERRQSEVTQRSRWREQREENQECDAGRAKRSEYFRRRVWPTVSHAAESRMGVMIALFRGCSGDSVTGSTESKPPPPQY